MRAVFVELPPFERHRKHYLDDDAFRELQKELLVNPFSGDVIQGTGGLRKTRIGDKRRDKGKRGGVRVIYYWWREGSQYWLFTLYDKNEVKDLTDRERSTLASMLMNELASRSRT